MAHHQHHHRCYSLLLALLIITTSHAYSLRPPPPVVILPGFGNDEIDYTNPLNLGEDASFAQALRRRGHPVYVVPVQRTDWLKFASGIVTLDFWKSTMQPTNPSFKWYIDKVITTVEEAADAQEDKVVLICHSAGGWLARAALRDGTWSGEAAINASDLIRGCITLGTPHLPPEPPGVDMTRGALTHVHTNYPGSYLKKEGIFYTTVCGTAVVGQKDAARRSIARFAYQSYRQVCGKGDVLGDGVVPLESAHLDDAQQITLNGVFYSINAPKNWYGSEEIIDQWLDKVEGLKSR